MERLNSYTKDCPQMPHADYRDIQVCPEEVLHIRSKVVKSFRPSLVSPKGSNVKRSILQKGKGVIGPLDDEQYIETVGLGPCIALVMHNLETETAGVAHIDASTSIRPMVEWLLSEVGSNARVTLVGGNILEGWEYIQETEIIPQIVLIRRCLEQVNVEIDDWDVMNSPGKVRNIIADKNTGVVYNSIT